MTKTSSRKLAGLVRSRSLDSKWLSAIGVIAAGLLLGEINVWGSRHFTRWDVTQDRLYTLSEPTLALLHSLDAPVEILSLLPKSDPLELDARHLLDAYRAESAQIRVRAIDPDHDVVAFRALGEQLDLGSESSPSGAVLPQASFVIRRGEQSWFVRSDRLVTQDAEGRAVPRLEALLTEGIASVDTLERQRICFITGHGERSTDDGGPEGLAELSRRLDKSNLEVVRVPLDVPHPEAELTNCQVIAVIGPERALPGAHVSLLRQAFDKGQNLLLLLEPIVDEQGKLQGSGLSPLAELFGLRLSPAFVLERDPRHRLPQGIGESFFAQVRPHPITRGLSTDEVRTDARPIVIGSQAIEPTDTSLALPLIESSPSAITIDHLSRWEAPPEGKRQALWLGAAFERATGAGGPNDRGPRAVIFGASNLASNDSFRRPELYGNRLLIENALSWLTSRPALVSVPERPSRDTHLHLSEESLSELLRYVLIYMPATTALLGLFVILRRRSLESHSRKEPRS